MKTELEIVDQVVNAGRKIQVYSHSTRNYLMHQVLEPVVQLMIGLIESDSGNSRAQNSALETRNIWAGWNLVLTEWAQAKEFRDSPHGVMEHQYDILVPTENEILTVSNVKVKRMVQQLRHLTSVLVGLDSATMQTWLGPKDIENVEKLLKQTQTVLNRYFGTGEGDAEGGFDTGIAAPEYAFGQLIPDVDRNASSIHEPSSDIPQAPFADAPDLDSIAPKPGTRQS